MGSHICSGSEHIIVFVLSNNQLHVSVTYSFMISRLHYPLRFRKPLRHNVCVGMLSEGFHRSFAELFALLQCWEEAEEHPHKLQTLQQHLTRAETAERAGNFVSMHIKAFE